MIGNEEMRRSQVLIENVVSLCGLFEINISILVLVYTYVVLDLTCSNVGESLNMFRNIVGWPTKQNVFICNF